MPAAQVLHKLRLEVGSGTIPKVMVRVDDWARWIEHVLRAPREPVVVDVKQGRYAPGVCLGAWGSLRARNSRVCRLSLLRPSGHDSRTPCIGQDDVGAGR